MTPDTSKYMWGPDSVSGMPVCKFLVNNCHKNEGGGKDDMRLKQQYGILCMYLVVM